VIPLSALRNGEKGVVKTILGGAGAHRNLMDLGIVEGKEIKVVKNSGGAVLVAINGTKLVVGRGLAMKVLVEKYGDGGNDL